jgi:hypothetical protein
VNWTILPLIFESASAHPLRGTAEPCAKSWWQSAESRKKWYFGITADRAWHGLLIASKIGVLKICKDAPASKEFS